MKELDQIDRLQIDVRARCQMVDLPLKGYLSREGESISLARHNRVRLYFDEIRGFIGPFRFFASGVAVIGTC